MKKELRERALEKISVILIINALQKRKVFQNYPEIKIKNDFFEIISNEESNDNLSYTDFIFNIKSDSGAEFKLLLMDDDSYLLKEDCLLGEEIIGWTKDILLSIDGDWPEEI